MEKLACDIFAIQSQNNLKELSTIRKRGTCAVWGTHVFKHKYEYLIIISKKISTLLIL